MKTQAKIILSFISLAIITLFGLFLSPGSTGYASSPASLSLGRTVVPEGDDFATRALGQPWNMNGNPYPDYFTALKNINRPNFEVTASGDWHLLPENSDPRIWLHWPGVGTTQSVLRMGDTRPIDASRYTLLSYYMCLNNAPNPAAGQDTDWAAKVYWMYDRSPNLDPQNGSTNFAFFKQQKIFENNGDCELMTVDLTQPSAWANGSWNNNPKMVMGLRLDPINQAGKSFELGWVRLTTVDTANTVPLDWTNAPVGDVEFYLSRVACGAEGVLVGKAANPTGSGSFAWGAQLQAGYSAANPLPIPESFEPGSYHVFLKDINGEIACSTDQLTVHGAPILDFQGPSQFSGTDYATNVVQDSWGMSNAQDIASSGHITNLKFTDGILTATTTGTDPRLTLNTDGPIDTSKYRYATFRLKIDGPNSAGNGWVQRFIWWYAGPSTDNVTTQDMMIYEGWHTYSIDLKTAGMEVCGSSNCWNGSPTGFRFDPAEAPAGTTFSLDFLTLTGIDSVNQGEVFKVFYTLPNAPDANVSMFLDTDLNPFNGRVAAPQMPALPGQGENPLTDFMLFMPTVFRPGGANAEFNFFAESLAYLIDTEGMAPNTYYLSADINDGVMTTTWYSDTPVIIK